MVPLVKNGFQSNARVGQKALKREKKLNNAFGPRGFGLKAY